MTDFRDPAIARHLRRCDPVLRDILCRHGPCGLTIERRGTPFQALVQAVAHQQLHGKAAKTILRRFVALVPGRRFPAPEDIAALSDERLRGVGFSSAKVAAIRDIAARTLDGTVPTVRAIRRLSDEAIIERLTAVRGVGRWTVEMLLISQLGRPDVLPVDDFGVRNGFRIAYGLDDLPKPKALLAHGERWRPWRSVVAWYLWRVADAEKVERNGVKTA